MLQVLQTLSGIAPMSEGLMTHSSSILKFMELPAKKIWLHNGHVCRSIAFIEKGLFRCFYNNHGHDVSHWFMAEGDVMIAVRSFFEQIPSLQCIEALEDSYVCYLDYNALQETYRLFPEFNVHRAVLTEKYYIQSEDRLEGIKMQRAPERYAWLRDNYSHFVHRIQAKYLASYLGIAEETLSRIKSVYDRTR